MALALIGLLQGCESPQSPTESRPTESQSEEPPTQTAMPSIFVDAASDVGVDFVHENGMFGEKYLLEVMGSGGALFDYDNDGDLDPYVVQSGALPLDDAESPGSEQRDRLYRNELDPQADGASPLRFVDVTEESGIAATDYGMGVATGDYNRDGWIDLYVTNYGRNRLWKNEGDGTFTDVTVESGADDSRWSVSAAFFDFDQDGWLDLYVGNYVDFRFKTRKECLSTSGGRQYCSPLAYRPAPDTLLRNRGDGTFENVTLRSGLREAFGNALGVSVLDYDADGRLDLYVANDGVENQLWANLGDGRFEDRARATGSAVNDMGRAEASMGIATGDLDGDGDEDLFLTHLDQESNTLYLNDGEGAFVDASIGAALAAPSWRFTGFGTSLLDYDNDGLQDLAVVNGAVRALEDLAQAGDPYPLRQPNQLFRNLGEGRFEEVTSSAGRAFEQAEVSRGLLVGDLENDGDPDLVVINNSGPVRVLVNQIGQSRHWLGVELETTMARGTVIGSLVRVLDADGGTVSWRRAATAGSYASASDPRLLFGLGERGGSYTVRVRWTSGRVEEWQSVPADRYNRLVEGTGSPAAADS